MTITVAVFREDYPEFASTKAYPDSTVQYWLNFAYLFIPTRRWGSLVDLGAELFAAHNISLEGLSASEGANGAPPGMTVGPIVTKTVGELTITYDPAMGADPADTSWNLTLYGTRFIKLAKQFGAAPAHLGVGRAPLGGGPAFPGVTIYTDGVNGGYPW